MAAAGAGIGAISGAAKWASQRMGLRREKSACGDNAACRAAVDRKIQTLNAGSLSGAVGRAAVGAAVGGAVGGAGKIAGFSGTPTSIFKAGKADFDSGGSIGSAVSTSFNKAREIIPQKISAAPSTISKNIGRFFKGAGDGTDGNNPPMTGGLK
jgi:hypothetical protein